MFYKDKYKIATYFSLSDKFYLEFERVSEF